MDTNYMAIDQFGNTYHYLKHPRQDLMNRLGYRSAKIMYLETKDGKIFKTGYVIGPYWLTLYIITPYRKDA